MNEPVAAELKLPPKVSGEKPDMGHMEEFNVNFARFLMRCNAECGELAEYNMAGQKTVLMNLSRPARHGCISIARISIARTTHQ